MFAHEIQTFNKKGRRQRAEGRRKKILPLILKGDPTFPRIQGTSGRPERALGLRPHPKQVFGCFKSDRNSTPSVFVLLPSASCLLPSLKLHRLKYKAAAVGSAIYIVVQDAVVARAQFFSGAQNAFTCIINAASGQSQGQSALFKQFPNLLFTGIEVIIFGIIIVAVINAASAYRQGEEITQVIQQPLVIFLCLAIIILFQTFLFGGANASCSGTGGSGG